MALATAIDFKVDKLIVMMDFLYMLYEGNDSVECVLCYLFLCLVEVYLVKIYGIKDLNGGGGVNGVNGVANWRWL